MRSKVKEIRVSRGMSQEALARDAGLTRQTIVNVENDDSFNALMSTYVRLAKALGCKLEDLIAYD